ncbi:MAG TPA: class III extradiol ring-cleavage dioxygenase [Salinivirgaceae bacterium]|nr:class III extradiol ring-cleavage dioxygenase [Salinivirgaceae bacterium]
MNAPEKLPVFYIPHGGGPWHVMEDYMGDPEGYGMLKNYLEKLGKEYLEKIKSLLVISAHWEEPLPAVHFGNKPSMFYDYYGFPAFTYRLSWPAPGNPELAAHIEQLLKQSGFQTKPETERGYDHGTFVPMMIAFPEANIPTAQLSLVEGLNPALHIALGKALEPLRSQKVLIICSGMSYHNLQAMMTGSKHVEDDSKRFDDWLTVAVELENIEERNEKLINWLKAPAARESHPRSEHLVPLFVAAGAAGNDSGHRDYSGILLGASISGFKFG